MKKSDHQIIQQLFDDYIRMYSSRDDLLTTYFSENFSGFTGGGDVLVKKRDTWVEITRQDFAQIKDPIRIDIKDVSIQSLADTIAVATGFFTINLPIEDHILAKETARLVLIFRLESAGWKISHSSISIPYHLVREGEIYPMKELVDRNQFLEKEIADRMSELSNAKDHLEQTNEKLTHEIAKQKLAEQTLQESERKLSTLIGNLPGMAYRCRHKKERPMEFISDGCLNVTGFSPSEILKDPSVLYGNIIYPDDRQYVWETVLEGVKNNKHFEMEYRIVTKSGDVKWVSERGKKVSDIKTHNIYCEGFIADINKQKILAAKLQKSQKMEAIGTLAGGIAHEFNNMLAIIMGNNELIMDEFPQGSLSRESAEEIRTAGLRARDVVKQLLIFSRQDDAEKSIMDFKNVVQESIKLIRSSIPVNIKIQENLSADMSPVMCNETQINQILINLCNNAVDALPEQGGVITIDLQQTMHQTNLQPCQNVKLMVGDNGIGMDDEILDRVFEPYYTTKDIGEGTGIGLAMVHGIVKEHDGRISVDSKPGQGTTFTIFLPIHEGLIEQATDRRNILPVGSEHILYVDDEPSIAKLGKRHLESLGYTAESITDPEKALDIVRNDPNKFDLLVTDMAMPNMTGDQLIIETLKTRQDMPTIICTGYSAKFSAKDAADIGARSYLMKPINKSELAKTVRKVLDGGKKSTLEKP